MNPELTPEQKQQLSSWTGQRDLILTEIATRKTENERLTKTNIDLSNSNTEIQEKVKKSEGKLEELEKKEFEFSLLIKKENAELSQQKTQLETRVDGLKKEIEILEPHKISLEETIKTLADIHDRVFGRADDLNKEIDSSRQTNLQTMREIENLFISIKNQLQSIININAENVSKTNVVINDLPHIIFDLQKDLLERRKFNKIKITP
jgi:predicted nuclease with TOPRIM domain